jgi:hypothetical protein
MTNAGIPTEKASSEVTLIAVITAIGTALAAFQLFQPKFAIGLAMKRETGRVETGFRFFYELPQYIAVSVVFAVFCVLFLAFLHQISPGLAPDYLWLHRVLDLLALQNLLLVLLMVACLAAFIQLNFLSWAFLWIGSGLSMFPIPKLAGAFGFEGRNAGWQQAWCLCRTWDKGQPLYLPRECRASGGHPASETC